MTRPHWLFGIFIIAALTEFAQAQGNDNRKTTVLDGVFTAAQAERGKAAYAVHCSSCHMEDLSGQAGPALKGQQFFDNWREDKLKSLFTFIQTQMPQRARGSLSDEMYVDVLSYILSANMFPAGSTELKADALAGIDVVGKDGPAPIPKFVLMTAVGCLAQVAGEWKLENASAPLRTREEKPGPSEVRASANRPLGTGTFRLVYIDSLRPEFVPESHVGHKLHVQGYWLSNEKGEGVSVTWLEAVAPSCGK